MCLRIAVPDLISNSYFPAVAAIEPGFSKDEESDSGLQHLFPVPKTLEARQDNELDFVARPACSLYEPVSISIDCRGALFPTATKNMTLLSRAWGEKNWMTASS